MMSTCRFIRKARLTVQLCMECCVAQCLRNPPSVLVCGHSTLTPLPLVSCRGQIVAEGLDVLCAVVVEPAANGTGAGTRTVGLRAHAAAGCVAVGTEAVCVLELAV